MPPTPHPHRLSPAARPVAAACPARGPAARALPRGVGGGRRLHPGSGSGSRRAAPPCRVRTRGCRALLAAVRRPSQGADSRAPARCPTPNGAHHLHGLLVAVTACPPCAQQGGELLVQQEGQQGDRLHRRRHQR
ncbi:hypothetical protein C2845_PM07G07380 [Panicum miliaceum]|uniref:Uncharacterized protein n=1 Tax=Panicum miliaceum TaxID=4540 RepID=A0A3L6SHL1_PANMI|nr:hypothetical protein C2845_PM07G07380 [Panicum miliaceum]